MIILGTKNNLPLSWLIRWLAKEDCSHFSITFDAKWTIHSNLKGVHIDWFDSFRSKNEIVQMRQYELPLATEEAVYQLILNTSHGKSYDWGGLVYLFIRGVGYKFFGLPLPARNPWGSRQAYLCTEIAQYLPDWMFKSGFRPTNFDVLTPAALIKLLKEPSEIAP